MTAIVGILCKEGVIIGTDGSATLAHGIIPTIEQPIEKLTIIKDQVIIASTGPVGLSQRFCSIIEQAWSDRISHLSALDIVKLFCRDFLRDLSQTFMEPKVSGEWNAARYGALVAFPVDGKPYLCEFPEHSFQPELITERLWYCSKGSTQSITDSFLAFMRNIFWQGPPTLNEGTFVTTWTLEHAIDVNAGGVNRPTSIAILEKKANRLKARRLEDEELQEHKQNIESYKQYMRQYRKELDKGKSEDIRVPDISE